MEEWRISSRKEANRGSIEAARRSLPIWKRSAGSLHFSEGSGICKERKVPGRALSQGGPAGPRRRRFATRATNQRIAQLIRQHRRLTLPVYSYAGILLAR